MWGIRKIEAVWGVGYKEDRGSVGCGVDRVGLAWFGIIVLCSFFLLPATQELEPYLLTHPL